MHPKICNNKNRVTDAFSLEISTKDLASLKGNPALIPVGTTVCVPYLPRESDAVRLSALIAARHMGLEPMPHISARRIRSAAELEIFVKRVVTEAQVTRCLLIAGDPKTPLGPFSVVQAFLDTGVFERNGITQIGVAGHPEGHAAMNESQCWDVLARKCQNISARGMEATIMTQFSFDADTVLAWIKKLRAQGMTYPVRIGVPGPAGVTVLVKYAAMCGVSACASVFAKYGISIGRLLATVGPDAFVRQIQNHHNDDCGEIHLHFFSFGSAEKTVKWIYNFNLEK